MSVLNVTKDNFETEVLLSKTPVLVDFYADWCGPCMMLAPIIDELADEMGDKKFCRINVDTDPEIAADYDVSSIPALFVFKSGEVTASTVGLRQKQEVAALFDE